MNFSGSLALSNGPLFKARIYSYRSKFFPLRADPDQDRWKALSINCYTRYYRIYSATRRGFTSLD